MVEQIKVAGVLYRGPFPPLWPNHPWKITAFLPSSKRSTSDQPVGAAWQTWKKFPTEALANAAWQNLKTHRVAELADAPRPQAPAYGQPEHGVEIAGSNPAPVPTKDA